MQIVLIHGLFRSRLSMFPLGKYLSRRGYNIINFPYASLFGNIDSHAESLKDYLVKKVKTDEEIHFITHSLGGIVLRNFLSKYRNNFKIGKIVMLGVPNQGSVLAKKLAKNPPIRFLLGPSLSDLASLHGHSLYNPCEHFEVGIISGGTVNDKGIVPLFGENNDGIVTLNETKLPGCRFMEIIKTPHSFLMFAPKTFKIAENFLKSGKFVSTDSCPQ